MSTPNSQTVGPCWRYEDTPGTASIDFASGQTNLFGHFEKDYKIDLPAPEKNIEAAQVYNKREPSSQAIANYNLNPFSFKFFPVNIQPMYRILGESEYSAGSGAIRSLDSGLMKSITIRHEQKGGTYPARRQAVGCFSTKLHCVAELDKDFFVEETFNYWKCEDQDDRVALTHPPVYPESIETQYQSMASVTYNGTSVDYIVRVEWTIEKEINAIAKEATSQILYPGALKQHALFLHGVINDNTIWDDYFHDSHSKDVVVRINKVNDSSKYIVVTFKNVAWKKVGTVGQVYGGYFHSIMSGVPESMNVVVYGELTNFTTHYP